MIGAGHAIFGIAAACDQRADLLADHRIIGAGTHGNNRACYLQSRNMRGTGRGRIEALALNDIGAVDPSSRDADQYLALRRLRNRRLACNQYFGATRFGIVNGLHDSRYYCSHGHGRHALVIPPRCGQNPNICSGLY